MKKLKLSTMVKVGIGIIFIFVIVGTVLDQADTIKYGCKPTGNQRFVNTIDGVQVENELKCRDGRTKWSYL